MGRIWKAYATRFRWLLQCVGARKLDKGVEWFRRKAWEHRDTTPAVLMDLYDRLANQPCYRARMTSPAADTFWCDSGLGGLARWLRAAGYRAFWEPAIDDGLLLAAARRDGAAILTTDSMLMERKVLRDRAIPSFWMAPVFSIEEQLGRVFREFRLELRPPRCMACGGMLVRGNKERLRDRIPPKTYLWCDDYFTCMDCGQLFWHGTHWERIRAKLVTVAERSKRQTAG